MNRPDPDELLDRLQRDEEKRRRGRLKIFFGASAGVGKTYAMLQAARRRAEEGVDVVVGIVETHGRSETAALTSGLDVLPRARIAWRGRTLDEFDLDAALARKPQLVLMERLFSNLLENAAKYTPPDTPLTVGARRVETGGQPFVRVTIDDNGPGLPPGMGERVFEKFTRGEKESAKPGIGLGLAICRAIVEAHGGTIGAANRVDADGRVEGASFWFALPVEAPPPLPVDVAEEAEAADAAGISGTADEAQPDPQPPALKPADSKPAHE